MSLESDLREALRRREEMNQLAGGKVLIWGPGDVKGKRKRNNLIRRLKTHGFDAHTSEELSKKIPSTLNIAVQEVEHWRLVDIVVNFCYSEGPRDELAQNSGELDFISKTLVYYPEEYDSTRQESYFASILKLFPYRYRTTEKEWTDCRVSKDCIDRVIAFRSVQISDPS